MSPENQRGGIWFNSITHINFINWMQFAKGILVATMYYYITVCLIFSWHNIFILLLFFLFCSCNSQDFFPCPHSPLALVFTKTALVKVLKLLRTLWRTIFSETDLRRLTPNAALSLKCISSTSETESLLIFLILLFCISLLCSSLTPCCFSEETGIGPFFYNCLTPTLSPCALEGLLQEWEGGPGTLTLFIITMIRRSWRDKWSRAVNVKQDQDICLNSGFLWTEVRRIHCMSSGGKSQLGSIACKGKCLAGEMEKVHFWG